MPGQPGPVRQTRRSEHVHRIFSHLSVADHDEVYRRCIGRPSLVDLDIRLYEIQRILDPRESRDRTDNDAAGSLQPARRVRDQRGLLRTESRNIDAVVDLPHLAPRDADVIQQPAPEVLGDRDDPVNEDRDHPSHQPAQRGVC